MRDRKLSHEQMLAMLEREVAVLHMRNEVEFQELRAGLVERYTEEGVKKVEEGINAENKK